MSSRRSDNSRLRDDFTSSMVQALTRVNEKDDKKIDPVPTWDETTSFEGWKKEIMIWSKAKGRQERKTQMLVEYLKKDARKGLKELVVNEFIENEQFNYEDQNALIAILEKIKEFVDESKWNKTIKMVKDFKNFKQEENEKNKDFVTRFTTFETRMRNCDTELPKMWLAAEMMTRSKLNSLQKHNIMATIDTENSQNILAVIKKKLKDLDGCDESEPKRAFYTDNKPSRSFSKDRRHGKSGGYKHRSYSRDRRSQNGNHNRSRSRNGDRRNSQRDYFQKDGNRSSQREYFQKDGNGPSDSATKNLGNTTPKRTYHVTLKMDNKRSIFENEVENKALVDSGCPELVAGLSWLKTYESSKGKEFKTVKRSDIFKMGNDNFKTIMFKKIPVSIGTHEEEIEVGIIDTEIPLLISKKKLKEWGGKIDFQENTLYLRKTGETIQMEETSTGHLVINMAKDLRENKDEAIHELFLMKKSREYNIKDMKKLHRVFGHPIEEKLKKLMNDAGLEDPHISRILKRIHETCRICLKYRKKQSRPKTALPKARALNEAVSMDLKPVSSLLEDSSDKRQILYIMDEFSRYTVAAISKSKEPESVAKIILDEWCLKGMGYPSGYFFCDNGTEFKGNLIEAIAKKTGIKVKLTPSYSSWSNGGIERKHGAIDLTIKKMMEDDKDLNIEDALKHSVWSRNMEIGKFGFSPYQIAYGKSPFLPGISEGNVLTDQTIPQEDIVRKHFLNQEKARIEMRKAEANNRLKEAFNTRIQPYHDIIYQPGDEVIYLNKDDKWDGPARVSATESKTLHVLQNGTLRKIATCRARPWNENASTDEENISLDTSDISIHEEELIQIENSGELSDASIHQEELISIEMSCENQDTSIHDEQFDHEKVSSKVSTEEQTNKKHDRTDSSIQLEDEMTDAGRRMETRPKRGSKVKYRLKGSEVVYEAIVKHVGKKASVKKNICWLENEGSKRMESVDFGKHVDSWDYIKKSKVGFKKDGKTIFLIENHTENVCKEKRTLIEKDMETYGVFMM